MAQAPVNFFSGAPLNRLSWLRESSVFLNAAALDTRTKWVVFKNGEPLMVQDGEARTLPYLSTAQIRPILGEDRIFSQGQHPDSDHPTTNGVVKPSSEPEPKNLQAARLRGPPIVFLGVKERDGVQALPTAEFKSAKDIPGDPYFAVDVSRIPNELLDTTLAAAAPTPATLVFMEPRSTWTFLSSFDAPIFSEARSMLDWNLRNRFCAGCGSPVYSLWGGWKLSCSSLLPWADSEGKEPCITVKGLHNFLHPRTDAVVIMAVIDEKTDRILLGHNKRFPTGFYSTMAGFVEPSESFEDAVAREIYEESGVRVHSVRYHSTQPWPYPANLMVGFYCYADAEQPVRVDLDTELEDARWFTREEVLQVLAHPQGTSMSRREAKNFDEEHKRPGTPDEEKPPFRLPNAGQAIAGLLISDWAHGRIPKLQTSKI